MKLNGGSDIPPSMDFDNMDVDFGIKTDDAGMLSGDYYGTVAEPASKILSVVKFDCISWQ